MGNCLSYDCDDDLGVHTTNDCGEELLGGGSGVLTLECNSQLTDPSNANQINAEIAAGRATLFLDVKVGIDEAAAVEVPSNTVGGTNTLATYNRSGTFIDKNVNANNIELYNKMFAGKKFGGMIIYVKGTEESQSGPKVKWIDAEVSFTGSLPMKDQNDEFMAFKSKFTWRKKTMPTMHTAPIGIF